MNYWSGQSNDDDDNNDENDEWRFGMDNEYVVRDEYDPTIADKRKDMDIKDIANQLFHDLKWKYIPFDDCTIYHFLVSI